MKSLIGILMAALLGAAAASAAQAEEYTKGLVKKVEATSGKVTVQHEPLLNLDMPAMTMIFRVGDAAILARLSEGNEIEFVAERVNGKLMITQLK